MNIRPKTRPQAFSLDQLKVLDICRQTHKYSEEFYQYLAEIHRGQGEIARIWGLLAVDKCNHSDAFKMAGRIKGEGISEICISAEIASHFQKKMRKALDGVRKKPPSVLDALGFAIKMEEGLNSVHFRHVVRFINEQDMDLNTSTLKSAGSIVQLLTEEYVNLTLLD